MQEHVLCSEFTYNCVVFFVKIKRCGEMARKLRFFREHITKAGFSPSMRFKTGADINLDYLEVLEFQLLALKVFQSSC